MRFKVNKTLFNSMDLCKLLKLNPPLFVFVLSLFIMDDEPFKFIHAYLFPTQDVLQKFIRVQLTRFHETIGKFSLISTCLDINTDYPTKNVYHCK